MILKLELWNNCHCLPGLFQKSGLILQFDNQN